MSTISVQKHIVVNGIVGLSAHRRIFLAIAPASALFEHSFVDVLNEDTEQGYQRRFNAQHSLDFRKYIQQDNSSTIPLTFNIRPETEGWTLTEYDPPDARLEILANAGKILSQVDCQHRLGYLNGLNLPLPFMCFLGLTPREEMEIFRIINSKAKGISTSLLDYHDAALAADLAKDRPELFIALQLNNNAESPWHRQLDLGGSTTSGLLRRASLRTMQTAIKRFLAQTRILKRHEIDAATQTVLDFWSAVALVLEGPWNKPRKHLVTKGVGVYALMGLAGDLYAEQQSEHRCDKRYFVTKLSEFLTDIDWTSAGPLNGLGGEGGAKSALAHIRMVRARKNVKVVAVAQ